MNIESNKVIEVIYNSNMGAYECYSDKYAPTKYIFYMDYGLGIKVGDIVDCERDDKGFYKRVWVNGKLKTNDNFNSINTN